MESLFDFITKNWAVLGAVLALIISEIMGASGNKGILPYLLTLIQNSLPKKQNPQ